MIKLFNLDLHISVIQDIIFILKDLYKDKINITNWSLSNHSWIFNKNIDNVDIINENTWININEDMINNFVNNYRDYLSQFDGFIVTHTPVFCLLYETFNKPIILINSTRYEQPYSWSCNNNINLWNKLNTKLKEMYDNKQLIAISNNKSDQEYLKLGTGIDSILISSLCLYTEVSYNPINKNFIIYNKAEIINESNNIKYKENVLLKYSWNNLYSYKGIIHIPYEISTMSIFEQYSANIPLIFPSKELLKKLIIDNKIKFFSRYTALDGNKCKYPDILDLSLNDNTWMDFWIDKADYYDIDNMKYITYFDNIDDLENIINKLNTNDISEKMKKHNLIRKKEIYSKWKKIIDNTFLHKIIKINFITFSNTSFMTTKRIINQAIDFNIFNNIYDLTENDIPEYIEKHKLFIQENKVGYGLWIWKPKIILDTLNKINDDEILIYCDSGIYLNANGKERLYEYINMLNDKINIITFSTNGKADYKGQYYVKNDAIMSYNPEYNNELTIYRYAGMMIIKKTKKSINLISEWLNLCENYNFINRNPSIVFRDLPHYRGNDCDNGLFNLSLSKYKDINYSIYPDETNVYIGNLQVRHANVDLRTVNFDILHDKPFQCRNITPKFGYE
jgi:hypothetical protein